VVGPAGKLDPAHGLRRVDTAEDDRSVTLANLQQAAVNQHTDGFPNGVATYPELLAQFGFGWNTTSDWPLPGRKGLAE
jgi:hypothetical protein